MTDFLAAARDFEARSRREINLLDLGIALLLEDFAAPMLVLTRHIPLRARQIISPVASDVENMLATIDPAETTDPEALELLGRGLEHRYRLMVRANRISVLAHGVALAVYFAVCAAIIFAPNVRRAAAILGGWLFATTLAMIVCRCDWHWRPRAGIRGGSG